MYNKSIIKNVKRKAERTDVVQFVDVNGVRVPLFSWIDINANELCNRRCVFCPRGQKYKNENVHMDLTLATKISKELKELEYKGTINICGNGEPLLHKDIVGLVKCFKEHQVEIVTNGDRLSTDLIKNLYDNGLKYFVVSMYDGPEQIERNNKLFKDACIDEDRYILRDRWHPEDDEFGLILTNRAGTMKGKKDIPSTACYYMHYSMQIDWNGDVLFCVQSVYDKSVIHGNLNEKSMLDIWSSNKIRDYRKKLGEGKRSHHPCDGCDAIGIIHGGNHAAAWGSKR
jgi:radical SAM protein with 4Fe4S-binding SPASM domain